MAQTIADLQIVVDGDASGANRAFDDANKGIDTTTKNANKLAAGAGMMGFGVAVAAGFGMAIGTAMEFDAQLSQIAAVGGKDAAAQMDNIRATALELGAATSYSASEAAAGMSELIKAGVPVEDVLNGGAQSMLNLAAATGSSVPQAASIMSASMTLMGTDAEATSNLISAAVNASRLSIEDWGYAMQQAGPTAKAMGVSNEDLATTFTLLSNAGFTGEQAGTAFRNILASMATPTKKAKKALNDLGVTAFDSAGNFVGMEEVITQLTPKWSTMTAQQKASTAEAIAGKEGMGAFIKLMDGGVQTWNDTEAALANQASAQEQANMMTDNLKGAMDSLMGSVETVSIVIGEMLTPYVQQAADAINSLVQWFLQLSPETQKNIAIGVAIVAGFIALAGAAALASTAVGVLTAGMGLLLSPVILVIAAIALLAAGIYYAYTTNFLGFADAIDYVIGKLSDFWDWLSGLWSYVTSIDWSGMWGTVKQTATDTWDSVKNFVSTTWDNISGKISTTIATITSTLSGAWNTIKSTATSAWNEVSTSISNAWNTISTNVSTVIGTIQTTISTAWATIQSAASTAWSVVQTVISTALSLIVLAITTYFNIYKTIILTAWSVIQTATTAVWGAISGTLSSVWSAISTNVSAVWTSIQTTISTVWAAIQVAIANALLAISTTITGVWNTIQTAASTVWNAIQTVISTVLAGIVIAVTTYFNIYKTIITTAFNAIKTVITTAWTAIQTSITTAMSTISSVLTSTWNTVKSTVTTTVNAIKTTVTEAFNTAKTNVISAVSSLKDSVVNSITALKSIVTTTFNSIKTAITTPLSSAKDTAITTITNLKTSAVNLITNMFNDMFNAAYNVGKAIGDGLIAGIYAIWDAVMDVAGQLADAVKNKIKDALHVFSPSKITTYYGEMVGLGLAKGMASMIPTVATTGENLAGAALVMPSTNYTAQPVGHTSTTTVYVTQHNTIDASSVEDIMNVKTFFDDLDTERTNTFGHNF